MKLGIIIETKEPEKACRLLSRAADMLEAHGSPEEAADTIRSIDPARAVALYTKTAEKHEKNDDYGNTVRCYVAAAEILEDRNPEKACRLYLKSMEVILKTSSPAIYDYVWLLRPSVCERAASAVKGKNPRLAASLLESLSHFRQERIAAYSLQGQPVDEAAEAEDPLPACIENRAQAADLFALSNSKKACRLYHEAAEMWKVVYSPFEKEHEAAVTKTYTRGIARLLETGNPVQAFDLYYLYREWDSGRPFDRDKATRLLSSAFSREALNKFLGDVRNCSPDGVREFFRNL